MTTSRAAIDIQDLMLFVQACMSSTGQEEFYDSRADHDLTLRFLHEYILHHHRDLYALLLAGELNHHNRALIIQNLLAHGTPMDPEMKTLEGALILHALKVLPPNRAYKALASLQAGGVSNRRTRAIVRDFLASLGDVTFHIVKYKKLFKQIASHFHLRFENQEAHHFLFTPTKKLSSFKTPLFETWRQAHYAKEALWKLPMTVAQGLAHLHGISQETFLKKIAGQMTRAERERAEHAAERHEVDLGALDWSCMPLMKACLMMLSEPLKTRMEPSARAPWRDRLHASAAFTRGGMALPPVGHLALVLDCSWSTRASLQKKNRPLALALATALLFSGHARRCDTFWTSPLPGGIESLIPRGSTNLGRPLLQALAAGPDMVVIVSDGYENEPPGGVHAIATAWEALGDKSQTRWLHLNPVFSAKGFEPRALSPLIPTLGIRDVTDIPFLMSLLPFMDPKAQAAPGAHDLLATFRSMLYARAKEALSP